MRKLRVFNMVSLDGYICDAHGDMSWAHRDDAEWVKFASENASGEAELLFGRVTYEMMAAYWPTPAALEAVPVVAERMNSKPKVVFSRTLETASWSNTKVVNGDIAAEVAKLKQEPGPDMVILGSASIVAQLTEARLIDEYQIVLVPIVLGSGKSMFDGVEDKVGLTLANDQTFSNGNVVLWYEPAG